MSRREQYLEALGVDLWRSRPDGKWQALQREVAKCTRCELSRGRTQTVFGVGNLHAELLVIGEAPGAEEDRQGEPFVGRAGQLLNSMLRAMGHPRGKRLHRQHAEVPPAGQSRSIAR
jgi:uracil-DNA glycosylase